MFQEDDGPLTFSQAEGGGVVAFVSRRPCFEHHFAMFPADYNIPDLRN